MTGGDLLDQMREHLGEWVAVKDGRITYHADNVSDLISLIRENNDPADSIFRVPQDASVDWCGHDL